ncbi:hypothetical protein J3F83DRAFT_96265 [Trichoderma novae-zelandiae]
MNSRLRGTEESVAIPLLVSLPLSLLIMPLFALVSRHILPPLPSPLILLDQIASSTFLRFFIYSSWNSSLSQSLPRNNTPFLSHAYFFFFFLFFALPFSAPFFFLFFSWKQQRTTTIMGYPPIIDTLQFFFLRLVTLLIYR